MTDCRHRRHDRDGLDDLRQHYGRPADEPEPESERLAGASELSRLSGVSRVMVHRLAESRMIPAPVSTTDEGSPLWDMNDERLQKWLAALQRAGYGQRGAR